MRTPSCDLVRESITGSTGAAKTFIELCGSETEINLFKNSPGSRLWRCFFEARHGHVTAAVVDALHRIDPRSCILFTCCRNGGC